MPPKPRKLDAIDSKEDTPSTKFLYIEDKGAIYFRDEEHPHVIGLGNRAYLFLGCEPPSAPGIKGVEGDLRIRDEAGGDVFDFSGGGAKLSLGTQGHGGYLGIRDDDGREVLYLESRTARLDVGTQANGGLLGVNDHSGKTVLSMDGKQAALQIGTQGHGGTLTVRDDAGRVVMLVDAAAAALYLGTSGNEGDVIVRNQAGKETIKLDGGQCTVSVRNEAGSETVKIDGKTGDVLLLGADCAEEFEIAGGDGVDAGTVLVIHDEGALRPCAQAYDRRVAGVVSGANGVNPGIILGRSQAPGSRQPIALSGRVYCKVDAQAAPIQVGDLLTTSPVPGHAMKAADPARSFGAVIGKALRPLESGRGLIPILVALQ